MLNLSIIDVKSRFCGKIAVLPIEKFSSLGLSRNAIMLQHLSVPFSFNYPTTGRLQEIEKKKENFKYFPFKGSRGRLQEVPNIVIWLGNVWYFRKLVAEERWSQPEIRLSQFAITCTSNIVYA